MLPAARVRSASAAAERTVPLPHGISAARYRTLIFFNQLLAFGSSGHYFYAMSVRAATKQKNWQLLFLCLVMALSGLAMRHAPANEADITGPWIAAAKIMRNGEHAATGIYLKPGLVITAAHLTVHWVGEAELAVRIGGATSPASIVKQGEVEDVDLTLFSADEQKLPDRVVRIETPLCQAPPWPGDPVIVVDHASATRSHIISPRVLPFASWRIKFQTLIADVASTGDSGSGVFDPNRKCLLGIMSRKFATDGKDIAKYFVPAREIRDFLPVEFRQQVTMR
jgi:hypothetical protein